MKKIASIFVLLSFLISCASSEKTLEQTAQKQRYWPAPPEQPRYEYLMSMYSSDDVVKKTDEDLLREYVSGKSPPLYIFKRPLDIAAGNGILYLLDSESPVVHVFDLVRRKFFKFGYRYEGKLDTPVGITVDQGGHVYVADRGRNSVIIYDSFGLYQSVIELDGITTQIAGLTTSADGNLVYVVDRGGIDSGAHQVIVMTKSGELVRRIGKRGKKAGEFNLPMDVALSAGNTLYVLDSGNFRVQTFNSEGEVLTSWGNAGTGIGQFGLPRSIALDAEDNVYITDAQFGNIQVFNASGELLMPIGRLSQEDLPGHYSLITGVTLDSRGHLYVLDQYLKKLEIFKKLPAEE